MPAPVDPITIDDLPVPPPPARVLAGRYALHEKLGAGGMGEVFRAIDLTTQREVAMKLLLARTADAAGHQRFQREMRHLQALHHPHIVAILDSGIVEGEPFLVMEYLRGHTLNERLSRQPGYRLALPDLLAIFLPLLDALAYLHGEGLIHRDLKPQNVMLVETANPVRLMDFGLARHVEGSVAVTQTGQWVGTPHYMAPEQASGKRLDLRADLYSVGVMLYEAVVGRLPFDAPDPLSIVVQHLQEPPPLPHHRVLDVPPALEEVILKLLEKEPLRRFASAREVAMALQQAAQASAEIRVKPAPVPRGLLQAPLIGRHAEMEQATRAIEQARQGQPSFLAVAGEAGVGKTRFLEEVSALARARGGRIVRAACPSHGAIALEPVITLLRALRAWEAPLPNPVDAQILATLLPEIAAGNALALAALPPLPPLPANLERSRLYDCLSRQIIAEATPEWLLLIIDDVHWADEVTLEWLAYLTRRLTEAGTKALVCGGLRAEAAAPSAALIELLRTVSHARCLARVDLKHLDLNGTNELVTGMLGQPLPALSHYLFAKTEGNPFFAEELLRALAETGQLLYTEEGWEWTRGSVELPAAVLDVVQERLGRLTPDSRKALSLAALIGHEFDFDVLTASGEAHEDQLLDWADEWLVAKLVRDLPADRFAFTHALIQEVAASEVKGPRLSRAHRRIAEAIERRRAGRLNDYLEALAEHYRAGGDFPRALEYSVRAGTQTAARSAYTEASRFFENARDLLEKVPTAEAQMKLQVYESLGGALERVGDYAKATDAFQQAGSVVRATTADWRHAAELARRMARTLGLQGKFDEAQDSLALARELLPSDDDSLVPLAARIEIQAATLHYWQGNLVQAEELIKHAVDVLPATPHQRELAEALNLLGVIQDVSGRLTEAVASYQASEKLWEQVGDEYQRTRTRDNLGVVALYLGRWAEAKALDEAGLAYWETLGDPNQLATARNNLGELEFARGDLMLAEAHFTFARDTWTSLHNPRLMVVATFNLAKVRLEQTELTSARWLAESARDLALEAKTEDYMAEGYRVLAQIYLAGGEPASALSAIQESLRLAQAQELKLDEAAAERVRGAVLMSMNRLADARPSLDRSLALLQTMTVPLELGRTWLEVARWHNLAGETAQALEAAHHARQIFETLGAARELTSLREAEL